MPFFGMNLYKAQVHNANHYIIIAEMDRQKRNKSSPIDRYISKVQLVPYQVYVSIGDD